MDHCFSDLQQINGGTVFKATYCPPFTVCNFWGFMCVYSSYQLSWSLKTLTSHKVLATDHCRGTGLKIFPVDSIDPQHSLIFSLQNPIELYTCFSSLLDISCCTANSTTRADHSFVDALILNHTVHYHYMANVTFCHTEVK